MTMQPAWPPWLLSSSSSSSTSSSSSPPLLLSSSSSLLSSEGVPTRELNTGVLCYCRVHGTLATVGADGRFYSKCHESPRHSMAPKEAMREAILLSQGHGQREERLLVLANALQAEAMLLDANTLGHGKRSNEVVVVPPPPLPRRRPRTQDILIDTTSAPWTTRPTSSRPSSPSRRALSRPRSGRSSRRPRSPPSPCESSTSSLASGNVMQGCCASLLRSKHQTRGLTDALRRSYVALDNNDDNEKREDGNSDRSAATPPAAAAAPPVTVTAPPLMRQLVSRVSRLLPSSSSHFHVVMIGLDGSGKTTILYRLKLGHYVEAAPTISFNCERVRLTSKSTCSLWDVGGQEKHRPLWRPYTRATDAIVYVVDAADPDRMADESRVELENVLGIPDILSVPLLVLANKQDLPGAVDERRLMEMLKIKPMNRLWKCVATCAITGDGLDQACHELETLVLRRRKLRERRGRNKTR